MNEVFVKGFTSEMRRLHFQNYIAYTNDLKKLVGKTFLRQWINGSFVTKKPNPKDIDLATFIDHDLIKKLGSQLDPFAGGGSWENYKVDAYIIEVYPLENKNRKFTECDLIEWQNLFTSTRRNRKGEKFSKGFLELIR